MTSQKGTKGTHFDQVFLSVLAAVPRVASRKEITNERLSSARRADDEVSVTNSLRLFFFFLSRSDQPRKQLQFALRWL